MRRSLLGLGLLVAAGYLPACGNDDRPASKVVMEPNTRIETGQILLSNAQLDAVANSDELRATFPTEDQMVVVHSSYLLFGVGRKNDAGALLIEIVGYGKIDVTTEQVTFGGFPGPLVGNRNDLTTVAVAVANAASVA